MSKIVCIDFDQVIHRYSKGWFDGTVYDEPVDGAKETIEGLIKQGYQIIISTARKDLTPVSVWLKKYDFPAAITVTNTKPYAQVYIDDKALHFQDWNQTIKELNDRGLT